MSNNIYDIMKKLNAVESIDVPSQETKNTTLLESTMQEVLSEKYMGFKAVAASAKKGGAKDPEAVAASIGRKKYGKEKFQKAAAAGKKLGEGKKVEEDDMEEGNKFTGNLAKARAAGKKRADLDGDGDMETVKEHGVAEGSLLKSIKRGLKGWGDGVKPDDIKRRAGEYSDDELKDIAGSHDELRRVRATDLMPTEVPKHSPAGLQKRLIDREMRKRGLGEQGVAEAYDVDHMPGPTLTYKNPYCTTCSGHKFMYKLDGKLTKDNKKGATRVKCPTCDGTGLKKSDPGYDSFGRKKEKGVAEGSRYNPDGSPKNVGLKAARKFGKKADWDATLQQFARGAATDDLSKFEEPKKKDPWGEGYWIGHRQEPRDCPYPEGSPAAEMWELGYHEGNKDRKKEMSDDVMEDTKETSKGRVHKAKAGGYGRKFDTDEEGDEAKEKKPAVKRGRGRPKKDADSDTGEVKKWDTSALQSAFGGTAPKKLPGKASVKHKMKDDDKDDKLDEVAPPGKKAERMVKGIKKGYAKDGKLTDKEKGIAYATTWKARNKGKVEESTIPPGFPKSLAKKIYEQCDGDMKNTLSAMWKVYNSVMESKKSSKKKISEGMTFEQSTTKSAMGTYKGGVWTATPPKKGEVGAPVPSPDEGAPVSQSSKKRPAKEDVSENKDLADVLKLAGMVGESVKVDECGMSPIAGGYGGDTMNDTEGRMSVSTNMSTDGNKTVTITADGDSAVELMKMLKMAGLSTDGNEDTDMEKMSEEKDDRYEANTTPEEEVLPVQTQLKGGNGEVAGKEKKMTPHGYKFADNPMAMSESMTLKLMKEYESIKKIK